MENQSVIIEEISDLSDSIDWDSGSNTIKLGRTEYAESDHSEPHSQGVPEEVEALVEQWKNDDNEMLERSFHLLNDASSPGVRSSADDLDTLVTELSSFDDATTEEDSPTTPTLDTLGMNTEPLWRVEGGEDVPGQVNHAAGTRSESSKKLNDNGKPVKDVEEATPSDHKSFVDEIGSVQSYADSIFDSGSVGSSASSLHQDTQAFVQEYVDFLVSDPGLEKLFSRSMSPTVLGPENFRRIYSGILQSYARDLKRQPAPWSDENSTLLIQGLAFISRRSITTKTASLIASRYMEDSPRTHVRSGKTPDEDTEILGLEAEPEQDTSSGDETAGNEPCYTPRFSELRVYFQERAPFQRMKRKLRSLVIPSTSLSRVQSLTERILDLLLGDEHLAYPFYMALSDPLATLRDDQFDPGREIRYFGSKLKAEAGSSDILRLAEFLEIYAGYIGTMAMQRMQVTDKKAVLQRPRFRQTIEEHSSHPVIRRRSKYPLNQLPKSIAEKWGKMRIEENPRLQRRQTYVKHQESPNSMFNKAEKGEQSLKTSWDGRDFLNTVRTNYPYAAMKLGFTTKLICELGLMRKNAVSMFQRFPLTFSVVIFALLYLFGNELSTLITRSLWSWRNAPEERREQDRDTLRYFAHERSVEDSDGIKENLRSQTWKSYRKVLSSTPREVLETIIDDNPPNLYDADIDTHWPMVASSKAFKDLFDRFRDTVIPTFFSEARRLVSEGLVGGDEDPKAEAGKTSLLCSLAEIQCCFVQTGVAPTISISTPEPSLESFRVSNLAKLAVEARSQSEWQWWPLQPPSSREKAKDTECRISWKCSCGTEREEIVPFIYASALSHLASQFPLGNEPPERPPSSLSSVSSQDTKATSDSESQSTNSGSSSAAGSSSLRSSTAATSPSSSVISFGTPAKAFVFLVVKASRYTLAPIDVTEKKARDFFQAIVEKYNQKRGWWRRLLSIYVYSHCDFVKIKRYAPQSFDPGVRFSFPPHDESPYDKEYRYYPRPMPHAPVSRHMFNHLYNACYSDQGLTHKLHYAFTAPSCLIKTIPGKLLDGMPKRDRLVDEEAEFSEDQDVEVFWGLVAREQRSALRVVMYMLLGLVPSLWFMFQWLFGWGHDGDLQDATVPFMLSVSMLGILWAVVFSGDDVREVEQPS